LTIQRRNDDLFKPGSQKPLDQSMKQVAVAGIFNSVFCKSPHSYNQFMISNPGTRLNAFVLFVTSTPCLPRGSTPTNKGFSLSIQKLARYDLESEKDRLDDEVELDE